jgi:translation initiation factor IF-1
VYSLLYTTFFVSTNKDLLKTGVVFEALPNTLFRLTLDDDGSEILAYLAGKMRFNRIKVLVGDKVEVQLDSYGGRARITRRM